MSKIILLAICWDAQALSISGQVLLDGAPKRGVKIYGSGGLARVRTDRDGRFRFDGLAPGTYLISILPASRYWPTPLSRDVTITEGDVSGIDFILTANGDRSGIFGRVAERRAPLEGVTLRIPGVAEVTTDRNGIFAINNLAAARYYLYPFAPNHTFKSSVRKVKLRAGRNAAFSFSAVARAGDESYPTWFTGLWDTDLSVTSTSCPTDQSNLDGSGIILQLRDRVRVKLPRLGNYSGRVMGNSLTSEINARRFLCRIRGNSSISFANSDQGTVTGNMQLSCLFAQPCELNFGGTVTRR